MSNKDQCAEALQGLQAKVAEYENILNEVLKSPMQIGKIEAVESSPYGDRSIYYRVKVGNDSKLINGVHLTLTAPGDLIPGVQVIVNDGVILGILPESLFEQVKPPVKVKLIEWGQIGGLKSQVERIRHEVETSLANPKLTQEFGVKPSKGILLSGAPGCGKTLIAKAIASMVLKRSEVDPDAFAYIKGAELLSRYVGDAEQAILAMFKRARLYMERTGEQAVIFIDEAEALLKRRGSGISSDIQDTIVPTFLSEMDGFDSHNPMLILATNHPETIDPAVLREGRIDLKVKIARPTAEDAREIFDIHLKEVKCHDPHEALSETGVNHIFSCSLREKVSGAMIATIVNDAARKALSRTLSKEGRKGVVTDDIIYSINTINSNQ